MHQNKTHGSVRLCQMRDYWTSETEHLGIHGVLALISTGSHSASKERRDYTLVFLALTYFPACAGDGFLPYSFSSSTLFLLWVTWTSINVAPTHVFEKMTQGSLQLPYLTFIILLLSFVDLDATHFAPLSPHFNLQMFQSIFLRSYHLESNKIKSISEILLCHQDISPAGSSSLTCLCNRSCIEATCPFLKRINIFALPMMASEPVALHNVC